MFHLLESAWRLTPHLQFNNRGEKWADFPPDVLR
jgi:hypothetical protein